MITYLRRGRIFLLYTLGLFSACLAFYMLSYGPIWNLAANGTLSWTTFEAIYQPIPSNLRSRLFAVWRRVDPTDIPVTSVIGSELHAVQEDLYQARQRTKDLTESFREMATEENTRGFEVHVRSNRESEALEMLADILRRRVMQEATTDPSLHKQ